MTVVNKTINKSNKSNKSNGVIKKININNFLSKIINLNDVNLVSNNKYLLSYIINDDDIINIIRNNQIQAVPIIVKYLELLLQKAFYQEEIELFKNYDIEHY